MAVEWVAPGQGDTINKLLSIFKYDTRPLARAYIASIPLRALAQRTNLVIEYEVPLNNYDWCRLDTAVCTVLGLDALGMEDRRTVGLKMCPHCAGNWSPIGF